MRARGFAGVTAALMLGLAAPAAAEPPAAVAAFFGAYDGESMYPADEYGKRLLSVVISPFRDDGFTVEWQTTMEKQRGDNRVTTDRLDFVPSGANPTVFRALAEDGGDRPTDPLDGSRLAWAGVKDDILSVHVLFIGDHGDYDLQTYDRARTEPGLTLSFVRVRNGDVEKRIWGSLYRREP